MTIILWISRWQNNKVKNLVLKLYILAQVTSWCRSTDIKHLVICTWLVNTVENLSIIRLISFCNWVKRWTLNFRVSLLFNFKENSLLFSHNRTSWLLLEHFRLRNPHWTFSWSLIVVMVFTKVEIITAFLLVLNQVLACFTLPYWGFTTLRDLIFWLIW